MSYLVNSQEEWDVDYSDYDEPERFEVDDDFEPDLDFMFECDSAFESIGWGDDDAYGGGEW